MEFAHLVLARLVKDLRHRIICLTRIAAAILSATLAAPCLACGYEDPQSIAIGALNLAFPDSLHLHTAIWQAQVDGVLPREATPASLPRVPQSFAANIVASSGAGATRATDPVGVAALMDALRVIEQARARLAQATDLAHRPPLTMVYASKMLWTRFIVTPLGFTATPHASGPESGDVVMITEASVIEAMITGALAPEQALQRKLVRLYGNDAAVASTEQWLLALAPSSATQISRE